MHSDLEITKPLVHISTVYEGFVLCKKSKVIKRVDFKPFENDKEKESNNCKGLSLFETSLYRVYSTMVYDKQ